MKAKEVLWFSMEGKRRRERRCNDLRNNGNAGKLLDNEKKLVG
jgi:hypothetical protein